MKRDKLVSYNMTTKMISTDVDNMLDMLNKSAAILRSHVYIVLEHHNEFIGSRTKEIVGVSDERIHGVYTTREAAEIKRNRLNEDEFKGYISILKFKIKGY